MLNYHQFQLNPDTHTMWHAPAPKTTMWLGTALIILLCPQVFAQNPANAESTVSSTANTTTRQSETISDVLIVLDSDGRSHTVQHTVATDGTALKLQLPGSVVPHEVMFFGPERNRYTARYKNNPSEVELSSGSAFARYQHQYGTEVQQVIPGQFVLTTPSVPANIDLNGELLSQSSISWVFPSEFELMSYTVTDHSTGRWVSANNTLTFHNSGNNQVELSITYKKNAGTLTLDQPACSDINTQTDACAEDLDEDGIPDYRDICISTLGETTNAFGCATNQGIILHNIEFETGRTYLDVTARHLLDKVAHAILKSEHTFYEVGAHTDNIGATQKNLQLSQKRSDAVRHYLMLKGVNPNALRATGYGEKYPVRDNSSTDGQRANRRIELVVIQ